MDRIMPNKDDKSVEKGMEDCKRCGDFICYGVCYPCFDKALKSAREETIKEVRYWLELCYSKKDSYILSNFDIEFFKEEKR